MGAAPEGSGATRMELRSSSTKWITQRFVKADEVAVAFARPEIDAVIGSKAPMMIDEMMVLAARSARHIGSNIMVSAMKVIHKYSV